MNLRRPVQRACKCIPTVLFLFLASCGNPPAKPPANTAGGGFTIETIYHPMSGPAVIAPGVRFIMNYVGDDGNFANYYPAGNIEQVAWITGSNGQFSDSEGRSPADWSFTWTSSGSYSQCSTAPDNGTTLFIIPPGLGVNEIGCYQVNLPSPGPQVQLDVDTPATHVTFEVVNEPYPPQTLTISGSGFDTTYGKPVVRVYDAYGNELASVSATSATANNLTVPTSAFSGVDYGTYYGFVCNIDSAGNLYPVGTGTFTKRCTAPKGQSCP